MFSHMLHRPTLHVGTFCINLLKKKQIHIIYEQRAYRINEFRLNLMKDCDEDQPKSAIDLAHKPINFILS